MKYKPLSVDTLPRVFVNLLAQEDVGIVIFAESLNECEEMKTWYETTNPFAVTGIESSEKQSAVENSNRLRYELAIFFGAVLNLSKVTRGMFVKDFARLLNKLGNRDFWGTEGQCDPRGDRRNADPYR